MVPTSGTADLLAPVVSARLAFPLRSQRRPRVRLPHLSVVVVNYCQWENTAALVRQLATARCARRGVAEVVVVDNHSPSHQVISRLRRWPGVSLRRWARNRGFARAVNEGCRLSRGEWFLLLNPDMTLPDGFLEGVLTLAEELTATEPRAGIVGFQLRNSDGSPQLSSGVFPTLLGTLAGLVRPRPRRKYQEVRASERCRVPWVTGCCLLVRRDCLQDLGGLDETYFLYYEDVDLCRRARARGWSVWYEPSLQAVHHNPLHGRAVPPVLRLITRHSLLTYSTRHWPWWQARLLAGIVRAEAWVRRLRAWWRGDAEGVQIFGELDAITKVLTQARPQTARRRLGRFLLHREPLVISQDAAETMTPLLLSVVIPTHTRSDLLRACLASVIRHAPPNTEVLVADDASPGDGAGAVARSFPEVRVLRLPKQRGFCGAANAGIAAASHPIVEMLNDDTEVTAGWAAAALAPFTDPNVAAVAPLVLSWPDGRYVDSAGDRYYVGGVAGKRGHGEPLGPAHLQEGLVFGASASSAYRREALLRVGAFPETFGAYFEDVDLAFRLQRAGHRAVFAPASRVLHRGSASHGRPRRRLLEQQSCNEERVFWRNLPPWALASALPRHLAVLAAKAWRRWQEGTLAPFLCGRLRLLGELPALARHRRQMKELGPTAPLTRWHVEQSFWARPRATDGGRVVEPI